MPGAVRSVRRELRRHLGDGCGDAQLCAGELLSNVILHVGAGAPVTVQVTGGSDGRMWLAVTDPEPYALPVRRTACRDEERGRGRRCWRRWRCAGVCGGATGSRRCGASCRGSEGAGRGGGLVGDVP
ncbi:hypothetical protein GCM10017688_49210 [Streptomyces ramulosus]